jgi:hypothetical protein
MEECAFKGKGKRVRLRANVFPHVKIRDWIIGCHLKSGNILLKYPDKNYTLEVIPEDIE